MRQWTVGLPTRGARRAAVGLALGAAGVVAGAACARRAARGEQTGPAPAAPVPVPARPAGPPPRVPLAVTADSVFWRTLHAGAYDQIPRAMTLLKAAYLQNPHDPRTTAHVGFLHAWAAAERARLASVPPT